MTDRGATWRPEPTPPSADELTLTALTLTTIAVGHIQSGCPQKPEECGVLGRIVPTLEIVLTLIREMYPETWQKLEDQLPGIGMIGAKLPASQEVH